MTLKNDNSAHEDGWLKGGWDGSYHLQYDKIVTNMTGLQSHDSEFIIIDNNKIQKMDDDTIRNLEK